MSEIDGLTPRISIYVMNRLRRSATRLPGADLSMYQFLSPMIPYNLSIDYRILPGSFPNPVAELECETRPCRAKQEAGPRDGGLLCWSASLRILCYLCISPPMYMKTQAPRYIQGSSPSALKATLGSVPCACVLVSPLYINRLLRWCVSINP